MPTLRHPDLNVALGAASPDRRGPSRANIYLALAAIAIFIIVRFVRSRLLKPPSSSAASYDGFGAEKVKPNLSNSPKATSPTSQEGNRPFTVWPAWNLPGHGQGLVPFPGFDTHRQLPPWAAGLTPQTARKPAFGVFGQMPPMDDNDSDPLKDRLRSGSASRGVSTSVPDAADFRRQHNPSPAGRNTEGNLGGRRPSRSSHFLFLNFSERLPAGGSDGHEIEPMSGHSTYDDRGWSAAPNQQASSSSAAYGQGSSFGPEGFTRSSDFPGIDFSTPRHFSRPSPPPPLTPPTLHDNRFPFEDRRLSCAASIPPELDTSFIHQPNPAYSGVSTSADVLNSSPQDADLIPRRRSYTRTVPIGIPIAATTSAFPTESMGSGAAFSPSSYPPTSPLLPPPPPGPDVPPEYVFVGGPGGPGVVLSEQEIDLHGEIISVMDHSGHGWKRHTRVYGGGVCLACLAAEDQGGFYGDKVPLADRR